MSYKNLFDRADGSLCLIKIQFRAVSHPNYGNTDRAYLLPDDNLNLLYTGFPAFVKGISPRILKHFLHPKERPGCRLTNPEKQGIIRVVLSERNGWAAKK